MPKNFPSPTPRELATELAAYLEPEPAGAAARQISCAPCRRNAVRPIDFLVNLNTALQHAISYVIRMEPGVQTPDETLELALGLLPRFRVAAGADPAPSRPRRALRLRLSDPVQADVEPIEGPKGTDKDFTDLHAWAEVYLPGAGWIGMDATSGLFCGEGHLPLCATPHYSSAAPISGVVEPAQVDFGFDMRVDAGPRGAAHHRALFRRGLGEARRAGRAGRRRSRQRKTFGSPWAASRPSSRSTISRRAEWNTGAVGPTKRALADDLIRRLRDRFAPGGFLHYGQGKWYPGESLPRWAFALYWRKDGEPIWTRPDAASRCASDRRRHATIEAARRPRRLARHLPTSLGSSRNT